METRLTRRLVAGNILSLFSGSAVAQGLTALALLLTARQLGPELYGQYTASIALASVAAIAFSLGLDTWLLREGGRLPGQLSALAGSVLALKGAGGLVWLVVLFLLAPWIDSGSFPKGLVRLSALVVLLDTLFATTLSAFKAALRNQVNAVLESGSDALLLVVTLILIRVGEGRAAVYLQGRGLVLLASLGVGLVLVARWVRLQYSPELVRRAIRQAVPFAASDLMAWAYMRADILIIAALLGEREVGLYAPAVGIINALFLIPAAVHVVIVPVLSNLFARDEAQAWRTAGRSLALLVVIGAGLALATFGGASVLTGLLGSGFQGSLVIFQTLAIILLIHAVVFGLAAILVATDQQSQRAMVQTLAVVLNVGLNLLAAPRFGIRGVALVYVATEIFLLAGYAWLVLKTRREAIQR